VKGTLGPETTDYEIKVEDGVSGGISAAFEKQRPEEGTLKLEILAGDEVIAERETLAETDPVAAS
jgi:hypothetical protein